MYHTLNKEELDLTQLDQDHKALLGEAYRLYQKDQYILLHNTVFGSESLKRMGSKCYIKGEYYVDKELSHSLIFRILIDLVDRKLIENGLLGLGENSNIDFSGNKKSLDDFLR